MVATEVRRRGGGPASWSRHLIGSIGSLLVVHGDTPVPFPLQVEVQLWTADPSARTGCGGGPQSIFTFASILVIAWLWNNREWEYILLLSICKNKDDTSSLSFTDESMFVSCVFFMFVTQVKMQRLWSYFQKVVAVFILRAIPFQNFRCTSSF